ncbi:MAG: GH92 family glycosyl hydrolase [Chthoniobacterales bacterium]
MNFCSHVNILQGTASTRDFSTGNTMPLVARPWGLHHWSLQTALGRWKFHPDHRKLLGVRLTHQPSPWMGDYGNLLLLPFCGEHHDAISDQASAWRVGDAALTPHFLGVDFLRYGLRMEMSPTRRGARFRFKRTTSKAICLRVHFDEDHEIASRAGELSFRGVSRNQMGGVTENFGMYFHGEFSVPPEEFVKTRDGGWWRFPKSVDCLELALAGSFISEDFAGMSFENELAGVPLESITAESEQVWNELLGRVQIETDDERQMQTFYSCLYRSLLFPRFFEEEDSEGREFHYSPYDGETHEGILCADNGFWDTHRTVYPLLALAYPDVLTRMLKGWLQACRLGGWTPRWSSPGAQDCMISTHFDAVVADAVARGITDWDVEGAFEFLVKNATVPSEDPRFGRRALADYVRLGYVPADRFPASVSRTLDYSYNDFCILQVAAKLGRDDIVRLLEPRTKNYRNVFDRSTGFMRGRLAGGDWVEPFDQFEWGGCYVEGGPWQHSFNVPHDPEGLAALHGGREKLCEKLDTMLASPARFSVGSYQSEIHEMTEMAVANFGQYAHSNQPVHGYLFLYALMGETAKAEHWIRRVTSEMYGPDFFPGDEDNGEMAAWYVLATLGLCPSCPGKPDYVRVKPLVKSASIRVPGHGEPIEIMPNVEASNVRA